MVTPISVAGRLIGPGHPCFVIAEAGVNHNGDPALARKLVDAAVAAGADAVKFQTFTAEMLVSQDAPMAEYQVRNTGRRDSQYTMLKRLELTGEIHVMLKEYCRDKNIIFLSTPFDVKSVDYLDSIDIPAYKVSSGDLTDYLLLEHMAAKGKPVLLSTGMARLDEVSLAVAYLKNKGCRELMLFHCVSAYPVEADEANLLAIQTLAREFNVPVGYSDHSLGMALPIAAVALHACALEKHITLDCGMEGPDHRASMEPDDFRRMVQCVREVQAGLGDGVKEPQPSELNARGIGRKSLQAAVEIPEGAIVRREMLAARRPGGGVPPTEWESFVGRKARRTIEPNTPLDHSMFT